LTVSAALLAAVVGLVTLVIRRGPRGEA